MSRCPPQPLAGEPAPSGPAYPESVIATRTSALAVASLALSLLSVLGVAIITAATWSPRMLTSPSTPADRSCIIVTLSLVTILAAPICGLLLGLLALDRIHYSEGKLSGRHMATVAIKICLLMLALVVILIILPVFTRVRES